MPIYDEEHVRQRSGRPFWVIGATDYNLGMAVANHADNYFFEEYSEIMVTDEQDGDVTNDLLLRQRLRETSLRNESRDLDIVYCAGINPLNAITDVDEGEMQMAFSVNVMGFIRVLQKALDIIPGRLNVVAVASDAARNPMRNSIVYCASKAALVQAVRVAARELAPKHRINAVSPGVIEGTPMSTTIDAAVKLQRGWSDEEAEAYERSMIPMQRRAAKQEVAGVILNTLNGPDYLTGSNIEITGGK